MLTDTGRHTLRAAIAACEEAEHARLAPLTAQSAAHLREALGTVVSQSRPHA
ncbi:hypothetical protein [Streptomyces shenzhenensis]|uniref:hypothetical protein n=1 Tax=Streptomyces shenzhenensis TaxID=943815 RepID=UPI001604ECD9|nr:hypothetical protein [Streptomyces shenzhenensis]